MIQLCLAEEYKYFGVLSIICSFDALYTRGKIGETRITGSTEYPVSSRCLEVKDTLGTAARRAFTNQGRSQSCPHNLLFASLNSDPESFFLS